MHTDGASAILVALMVMVIAVIAYMSCQRNGERTYYASSQCQASQFRPTIKINSVSPTAPKEAFGGIGPEAHDADTKVAKVANADADDGPENTYNQEQSAWYATDVGSQYQGCHNGSDSQSQDVEPSIDYMAMLTGQVADGRTLENHSKWAAEMQPWTGSGGKSAMLQHSFEPENSIHKHGLKHHKPQSVKQDKNRLFITEFDDGPDSNFSKQATFKY